MNGREDNRWLDEALSETIGSETPATDFEQWKQQHPQAVHALTSRAKSRMSTMKRPHRMKDRIMKNPFLQLSAAAVIVAAILTVALLNQTAAPVWAIDQTIEALNSVTVVHLSGYAKYADEPRHSIEVWAMPNSTDASVSGNFRLTEGDRHIAVANEKENITYVYTRHPKGDVVYVTRGLNRGCTPFPMSDLFRQFKAIGHNWKERYGKDEETGRDCVYVTFAGPPVNSARYWKVQFDVQTKLPIRAGVWESEDCAGEPHFGYTSIEYGRTFPEGCFDFDIPEGTQVVDCGELRDLLDQDAAYGMRVGDADTHQACAKVVEAYWQAVIEEDYHEVATLRPLAVGNGLEQLRALYAKYQPAELLNVSLNHVDDPGTFVEAACTVKMKDGKTRQSVLNVEVRPTPHGRIGVVAGSIMGELTEIE